MRAYQRKNIEFVKSHLKKPIWYNQCVTHPNWVMIKKHIKEQTPIEVTNMPPVLVENYAKMTELKSWYESTNAFVISPPRTVVGATAA